MAKNRNNSGFTLAEVLITITLIGVVSALTIPVINQSIQSKQADASVKKAYSTISQAVNYAIEENGGTTPRCMYWENNPYGSAKCTNYDENGYCTAYALADDSPLPSDYNGALNECDKLLPVISKYLSITKKCAVGRAITDGCIPAYKGNDVVLQDKNPDYTTVDINKLTSGCTGFQTSRFSLKEAWVLNNGMIMIPYSTQFRNSNIVAFDVNGLNGPNRAGYDLFFFYTKGQPGKYMRYTAGGCEYVETGGRTTAQVLQSN